MRIVFVGSNPSEKSVTNTAFEPGTKSLATLISWIEAAGLSEADKFHANIYNHKTPGNRPLNRQEVEEGIKELKEKILKMNFTHIVALGKTAHEAMKKHGIPHLSMPHPSGLNRKLNDPKYVQYQIDCLRSYSNGPGLNEVTLDWPR